MREHNAKNTEQYVHVLLFACPECDRPVTACCVSEKRNLEIGDASWFRPHCYCGWTGDVAGVTALKHWVETWRGHALLSADDPGSCKGEELKQAR